MEFTQEEEALFEKKGVTERGKEIARIIMGSPPARLVKASAAGQNRAVRFPSMKMGVVIQAESITLEFAGVLQNEFKRIVWKFYDQPFYKLDLVYKSGRRTVHTANTLDGFVIAEDFVGFEEYKRKSELFELSDRYSGHYYYDELKRRFFSPAIANSLSGSGLSYRIKTEDDLPAIFIKNLEYLKGYLRKDPTERCKQGIRVITRILNSKKKVHCSELYDACGSYDSINYAICLNKAYFPLEHVDIANHDHFFLYKNRSFYKKHAPEEINPIEIFNHVKIPSKLLTCSPEKALKKAKLLEVVQKVNRGKLTQKQAAQDLEVSTKTIQRAIKKLEAVSPIENALSVLMPNDSGKGPERKPKLEKAFELLKKIIFEFQDRKQCVSALEISRTLTRRCRAIGIHPPVENFVYTHLSKIPDYHKVLKTQGQKAAYQFSAYQIEQDDTVFDFASYRYLQLVHIDHTKIDLEVIGPNGEAPERPWLTMVQDDYTGFILAIYISFNSPSYVALMMAIRNMIKTHGVISEAFIFDGGKEFQSVNWEKLLAFLVVEAHSREGQPRGGNRIERQFGILNTTFFHNLLGNTKIMKNVRAVSRTHLPKNLAEWQIQHTIIAIHAFCFAFNNECAFRDALSPVQLKESSEKRYGERDFLKRMYDSDTHFLTLPISKLKPRVKRNLPVRHDRHDYWHPILSVAGKSNEKVDVKYDPEDPDYIYFYYRGEWRHATLRTRVSNRHNVGKNQKAEQLRQAAFMNEKAKSIGYQKISDVLDALAKERANTTNETEVNVTFDEIALEEEIESSEEHDFWNAPVPSSRRKDK